MLVHCDWERASLRASLNFHLTRISGAAPDAGKRFSSCARKHVRDCRKVRSRRSRFELLEDLALLSISAVVPQWLEEGPGPIINDATHVGLRM